MSLSGCKLSASTLTDGALPETSGVLHFAETHPILTHDGRVDV